MMELVQALSAPDAVVPVLRHLRLLLTASRKLWQALLLRSIFACRKSSGLLQDCHLGPLCRHKRRQIIGWQARAELVDVYFRRRM